jgi:isocitrate/isopropylmalate dehydrogenase
MNIKERVEKVLNNDSIFRGCFEPEVVEAKELISDLYTELEKHDHPQSTLRDEIAIAAMQNHPFNNYQLENIARYAYDLADEFLKQRSKTNDR